ncbi:hypothetical protein [Acinetobacter sp. ESBL14]|uniref:hypothetical protein n=1 Tax=Acinetobacter sp. ESBL14 TaxID=3077329 RepID=UPI002FCC6C57
MTLITLTNKATDEEIKVKSTVVNSPDASPEDIIWVFVEDDEEVPKEYQSILSIGEVGSLIGKEFVITKID